MRNVTSVIRYVAQVDSLGVWTAIAAVASAITALIALRYAYKSSKAAAESADRAADLASIETERRHDELAPSQPIDLHPRVTEEFHPPGLMGKLVCGLVLSRNYRVRVTARNRYDDEEDHIDLGVVRAYREERMFLQYVLPNDCLPTTNELLIRFWPPSPEVDDDHWTCTCGRPVVDSLTGPGHWEALVEVPDSALEDRPALQHRLEEDGGATEEDG